MTLAWSCTSYSLLSYPFILHSFPNPLRITKIIFLLSIQKTQFMKDLAHQIFDTKWYDNIKHSITDSFCTRQNGEELWHEVPFSQALGINNHEKPVNGA